MQTSQIFQYALAITLVLIATCSAFFDGEPKQVFCKGQEVKKQPVFHKNMKLCLEEMKAAKANTPAETRKRGKTCIAICALSKDGLFDDKGVFQKDKMFTNVEGALPADLAGILKTELEGCVTATKIEGMAIAPTDTICKSHKQFLKCTAMAWMKTCIEGFDPEVWNDSEER